MTIWKFDVDIADEIEVSMPKGARILSVQMQYDRPRIWALVDPSEPMVPRHFAWRGTGHNADGLTPPMFIGTVQAYRGELIFHLFERK